MSIFVPTDRPPTHPGEFLREEFIKPLDMHQKDVAKALKTSAPGLNNLLNGRRELTANMALRWERAFGVSAETWLNMQMACNIYKERHSRNAETIKEEIRPLVPA